MQRAVVDWSIRGKLIDIRAIHTRVVMRDFRVRAARQGIEPRFLVPETNVLPLDDPPA